MGARGCARPPTASCFFLAVVLVVVASVTASPDTASASHETGGVERSSGATSLDAPAASPNAGVPVGTVGPAEGPRLRQALDPEPVPRDDSGVAMGLYRNAPAPSTATPAKPVAPKPPPSRRRQPTPRRGRHRGRPSQAARRRAGTGPPPQGAPRRGGGGGRPKGKPLQEPQVQDTRRMAQPLSAVIEAPAAMATPLEGTERKEQVVMIGSSREGGARSSVVDEGTEVEVRPMPPFLPIEEADVNRKSDVRNREQDTTSSPADTDSQSRSLEKSDAVGGKDKEKDRDKEKDKDKDKEKDSEKEKDKGKDKKKDSKAEDKEKGDAKLEVTTEAGEKYAGLEAMPGDPVTEEREDVTKYRAWKLLDTDRCGLSQAFRIIGGEDASLGAYPWIVRIGYLSPSVKDPLYRCGGVLVNKLYVVTAAHCVTNLPRSLKVAALRLGEHSTDTNPDCEDKVCADPVQDFRPATVLVHKEYNQPQFKNDIALIRLDREAKVTYWVMPICMMSGPLMKKDYVNKSSEVAGWGIYDIDVPKPATVLQTLKLNVVENERCVESFQDHAQIGPTQMCVGGDVGHDSCGGDSGGPLMTVEKHDGPARYYLLGVVSFGAKRCGATTMPGVYTRVSSFMPWILENMHA